MPLAGRSFTSNAYRYGYQGQFAEKDAETGMNNFELRQWESRLGRWLTIDPYMQYHSPYLGMPVCRTGRGNNPVSMVDPDGGQTCWADPRPATNDVPNIDSPNGYISEADEYMALRGGGGGDGGDRSNYACSGANASELGQAYEAMGFSKNTAELFVLQNTGVDLRSNITWNLSHDYSAVYSTTSGDLTVTRNSTGETETINLNDAINNGAMMKNEELFVYTMVAINVLQKNGTIGKGEVEIAGYGLNNKSTKTEEYFIQPWAKNIYTDSQNFDIHGNNPITNKPLISNHHNYERRYQIHTHPDGGYPSIDDMQYSTNWQIPCYSINNINGCVYQAKMDPPGRLVLKRIDWYGNPDPWGYLERVWSNLDDWLKRK